MTRPLSLATALIVAGTLGGSLFTASAKAPATDRAPAADPASQVERGRYLVTAAGCNDCHTPMVMGPSGPYRDPARLLSGHPETLALPPAPAPSGPWMITAAATMTAWNGPWGTSFTANLTPDPETGLGTWSAQTFIDTIRNGRHMGKGRPLLPPMPADMIRTYTDEDLTAIFAYLQSVPPVKNRVPEPLPPAPATN